ncbi:uncharacterized protein [Aquarana catesbeiana]|uniref:uncharacterized protein n=1 Tax=Aquarana catesbeiana TaxID=8400 RepID=UPI003CC9946B
MIFCFYLTLLLSFQYFVFGKLMITQVPNELEIHKGESVNMTCRWNITDAQRIRVEWRKYNKSHPWDDNGTLLSSGLWTHPNNTTIFIVMNQNRSSYIITNDTAMMTLESITEEDEGLYVCKIVSEIPTLITVQGNGTLLHVHNNNSDDSLWYLYFIILLIIPILITVFCCFHRWKKEKELFQDHTYGNVTRNTRKDTDHPGTKIKKSTKKTTV